MPTQALGRTETSRVAAAKRTVGPSLTDISGLFDTRLRRAIRRVVLPVAPAE